jgi:DNA polymerase sigma
VGELLIEFFRYFCWSFDLRHRVVSIRQPRALSKLDKAEQNGWLQSDNLGYERVFCFSRTL